MYRILAKGVIDDQLTNYMKLDVKLDVKYHVQYYI